MNDIKEKKKSVEIVGPLLKEMGDMVSQVRGMEKAEFLNAVFAKIFTNQTGFQESEVPETREIFFCPGQEICKQDGHL